MKESGATYFKNNWFTIFVIILLILGGVFASTAVDNTRATRNATNRARTVIFDSTRKQATSFSAGVDGMYTSLLTLSSYVSREADAHTREEMQEYLNSLGDTLGFERIDLVTSDGLVDGKDEGLLETELYARGMAGKPWVTNLDGSRGRRMVIGAPVTLSGEVRYIICGVVKPERVSEMLAEFMYNGEGYTLVVATDGDIRINTLEGRRANLRSSLEYLQYARFDEGDTYDMIMARAAAGISYVFSYEFDSENEGTISRISAIAPFESKFFPDRDWFIVCAVNADVLDAEINAERSGALGGTVIALIASITASCLLVLLLNENSKQIAGDMRELCLQESMLRAVIAQTQRSYYRYDIKTGSSVRASAFDDGLGGTTTCEHVEDWMIDHGSIAPESVNAYRRFYRRIEGGESPVADDFLFVLGSGERAWYRHISTTLFDADGKPETAVISYYNCTQEKAMSLSFAQAEADITSPLKPGERLRKWNIKSDERLIAKGEHPRGSDLGTDAGFDEMARFYVRTRVHPADRNIFATTLNRERLIGQFHEGVFTSSFEYREELDNGQYAYFRTRIALMPGADDIIAYLRFTNVDDEMKETLARVEAMHTDATTGSLTYAEFVARADAAIHARPKAMHAVLFVEAEGLGLARDIFGSDMGSEVRRELANTLKLSLHEGELIGVAGHGHGDAFVLFLKDVQIQAALIQRACAIRASFTRKLRSVISVSLTVGVSVYPGDGADAEKLIIRAWSAARAGKKAGRPMLYAPDMPDVTGEWLGKAANAASFTSEGAMLPEQRETLLVVCEKDESGASLIETLASRYEVLTSDSVFELDAMLSKHYADVDAIIFDIDTKVGESMMAKCLEHGEQYRVPLIAATSNPIEGEALRLANESNVGVLARPLDTSGVHQYIGVRRALIRAIDHFIQKQYSQLVRIDEERNQEILGLARMIAFTYDLDTRAHTIDPSANRYIDAHFDGRPIEASLRETGCMSSNDIDKCLMCIEHIRMGSTNRSELDVPMRTPGGETRFFRISFTELSQTGSGRRELLVTVIDDNDRILAERRLLETSTQLRTIIESMTGGIALSKYENFHVTEHIFVSDRYCDILGYTQEQFRTELSSVEGFVHPDDYPEVRRVCMEAYLADKRFVCDFRARKRDGSEMIMRASSAFITLDRERVMLSVMTDITDQTMAERVRKTNEKLAEDIRKAQLAAKTKGDFLTRMSHDIRTPLNVILGFSDSETYDGADNAELINCLVKINDTGKYLLGLVNDVLDMSKLETGNMEFTRKRTQLRRLLDAVYMIIRPLATSAKLDFNVDESFEDGRCIMCDGLRLQQVLVNLLSNAVKFTPAGHNVSFGIRETELPDGRVLESIIVRDTGIGMSPHFIEHMYDPFVQAADSPRAGSGLGLSIVKSIVDAAGGKIRVESAEGTGTTFFVELHFAKCENDNVRQAQTEAQDDRTALSGRRVLLCEDHPLNSEIAKRLLTKTGVDVKAVENGKLGVEAFAASPEGYFDAILMDIRMPEMDGVEATRHIRALPRPDAKTVPIIAMTANAFEDDVREYKAVGMAWHVPKPVDPDHLFHTLRVSIEGQEG